MADPSTEEPMNNPEREGAGTLADRVFGTGEARSRFLQRTLYGVLYAGIVLGCIFLGELPTAIVVSVMSVLATYEFFQLMRTYGRMPNMFVGIAASAAFPPLVLISRQWLLFGLFVLFMWLSAWYISTPRASIADVAVTVLGSTYIGLMFSSVVWLRVSYDGAILAAFVVFSNWANDACAYMVGSRIGQHKMAPKISPKKSWEGALGGLAGTLIIWVILSFVWAGNLGLVQALVSGAFVCVAGVMGDLVESRIKRGAGVKDSGSLMPGHGGMFDRSDSLLFACTTAYVALRIWGVI